MPTERGRAMALQVLRALTGLLGLTIVVRGLLEGAGLLYLAVGGLLLAQGAVSFLPAFPRKRKGSSA